MSAVAYNKFTLLLTLVHIIVLTMASLPTSTDDGKDTTWNAADCLTNSLESTLYCRGSRAIRNVIHNLSKSDKPLVLLRGLEIVPVKDASNATAPYPGFSPNTDDSFLGRFSEYLRTHELNIKFSDLLTDESKLNWARDLERNGAEVGNTLFGFGAEEARKKDKGQGMLLAMAMMSAKMMAALGMGGIAALAMKALGVAMMALLMAGIVGIKSAAQNGHESSHSVSYVNADGHHHKRRRRRRRSVTETEPNVYQTQQLAYSGWPKSDNGV